MVDIPLYHAGNGIDLGDPVDLIPEKFHPDSPTSPIGRVDFQRVSPDTELVTGEIQIIPFVTNFC